VQVDFFIVGVQKGGTTALDSFLRRHPQIQMAKVKEVHFFDDESADWSEPDYSRLHDNFDWTSTGVLVRGEATPIYSYWPGAMQRLRRYNPSAKLLMSLRHPTFRAFSHWRMEKTRKNENLAFRHAIGATGRRRVREAQNGVHRIFSYIERGYYAPQIESILRIFPKEQILFFRTDHLWSNVQSTIDSIQSFLDVDLKLGGPRRYIVPEHTFDASHNMDSNVRAQLDALFADDICRTSALTGLNLTDWLHGNYREPMRPESVP
jgi:Sulfotransferase domain